MLGFLWLLPLGVASLSYNCTDLSTDPRHNIELGHKGSGVYLHGLQLTDLQVAVFLGRADCVEGLSPTPPVNRGISPRERISTALYTWRPVACETIFTKPTALRRRQRMS